MKHLRTAAAVLIAIVIAIFVIPRYLPFQESVASYGFYRGSNNSIDWANLPVQYVNNTAACSTCHTNEYKNWQNSVHKSLNCETCHGPAKDHLATQATLTVDTSAGLCNLCHSKLPARPANFPQITPSTHSGGALCVSCHNPHSPGFGNNSLSSAPLTSTNPPANALPNDNSAPPLPAPSPTVKSLIPQIPHTLDGRSNCLVCHSASGPIPYPQSHTGRTADTCLTCHQTATATQTTSPAVSPTPTRTVQTASYIPHTLAGRTDCLQCHGVSGIEPYPKDHSGRTNDACLSCHRSITNG